MTDTTTSEPAPPPPPPPWAGAAAGSSARWSRLGVGLGAAAVAGGCLYLALVDPSSSSAYPQCPLRLVTGLDCAGCGGLRATHALLNGDLVRAADHNLLLLIALPFVAYAVVQSWLARRGRRIPPLPWHPAMTWVLVAVIVAYSVLRNTGWGPGPYLHSDLTL